MEAVEALVVDIDGVLTVSWEPIPGAVEALRRLQAAPVPLVLATNTTTTTRAQVAEALAGAGMDVDPAAILTAPTATASHLRAHHPGARVLLVNDGDLGADLAGVEVVTAPPADVVVLGGAGPAFTYEALDAAFGLLLHGAPLVAMHRNLTWRTRDGLRLDSGGFVVALEAAAGVEATVVGKPARSFFDAALASLGLAADRVAMVGDDVHSDVLGAQACGLHGVLVRTGKYRAEEMADLPAEPEVVVGSFAEVPDLLGVA